MSSNARDLSDLIMAAYETHVPIAPLRTKVQGVPAAYAIQRECLRTWLERGRKVVGQKIGLTSKAIQTQLGVDEPDFGTLFSDMILTSGSTVRRRQVLQPRIEAEVAFVLKTALVGTDITPEKVIAATDYVAPAIEICGSRISGWDIKIEDTIADNASSGLVVLGEQHHRPDLEALTRLAVTITHDGAEVANGEGTACLGNPAIAVGWLANTLTKLGGGLRAGDIVMSGALAKMIPAAPGSRFVADFGSFGSVAVDFAA